MRASIIELIDVLEEETLLVKQLVLALQEDQQRIIKQDVEGLEESNRHKEERVVRFQALEQVRQNLTERIGQRLGLQPDELRVARISPLLGEDGKGLEEAADKLRAVVASLGELVAVSQGFLEQSILGIRGLLSLIQSMRTPDPGTYNATGRFEQSTRTEAISVRKEV